MKKAYKLISRQIDWFDNDDRKKGEFWKPRKIKVITMLLEKLPPKPPKVEVVKPSSMIPNYWQKSITHKHKEELEKWEKEEQLEMERATGHGIKGKIELNVIYRSHQ
jgi:hypothetical protein